MYVIGQGIGKSGFSFFDCQRYCFGSFLLHLGKKRYCEFWFGKRSDLVFTVQFYGKRRQRQLFFACQRAKLFDGCADFSDGLFCTLNRGKHFLFCRFLSPSLYHRNANSGSCYDDLQSRGFNLSKSWVYNVLITYQANTYGSDRASKRNIRNMHRSTCGIHGQNVGRIYLVRRNAGRDYLNFSSKTLVKKRSHRAVDNARHQNFFVFRPCLPLNKSTWNFAGCVILLVVFNCQRYKIQTLGCCT